MFVAGVGTGIIVGGLGRGASLGGGLRSLPECINRKICELAIEEGWIPYRYPSYRILAWTTGPGTWRGIHNAATLRVTPYSTHA